MWAPWRPRRPGPDELEPRRGAGGLCVGGQVLLLWRPQRTTARGGLGVYLTGRGLISCQWPSMPENAASSWAPPADERQLDMLNMLKVPWPAPRGCGLSILSACRQCRLTPVFPSPCVLKSLFDWGNLIQALKAAQLCKFVYLCYRRRQSLQWSATLPCPFSTLFGFLLPTCGSGSQEACALPWRLQIGKSGRSQLGAWCAASLLAGGPAPVCAHDGGYLGRAWCLKALAPPDVTKIQLNFD